MFKLYVEIYRALGSPSFEDGETLSVHCPLNPELLLAIKNYESCGQKFREIDFDFHEDGTVEFDFKITSFVTGAIFRDMDHFMENTPSILKGEFRNNFYIVSLDYFFENKEESKESKEPEEIRKVRKLTEFIKYLREFVALSIDKDQAMQGNKIFFLKPSDGKSPQKAATLKIRINPDILNYSLNGFSILKALTNPEHKEKKTQVEERILLMNTAIAQVIDECEDDDADFDYLVKNWGKVNKKYLHDLHAYVSTFSFDAVKKKISDGLIESTTKINNSIGEVATKLLAIPASLGALIVVGGSTSTVAFIFGIIGVIVASLIILRTIWHYQKQIENLANSFDFNMRESTKAKKTFSRAIQEEIKRINDSHERQKEAIGFSFSFYYLVALLPIFGSLYYIFDALWPILVFDYYLYKYCLTFNIY